ncbi:MAG: tetratricopeptide repeat protein [Desulfuromonadaceae bacterium]|nr:tetratricopeptide repeat protein [Desulfuromonadaceae bacterium]MDD2847132.1 tetratricopeptide repeat protein [Desulfuromonadaceae bacterium]MDD4130076.1 tetratricopeptide repeat protein [Desulfuromonadaceae bacterium]
MVPIQVSQPAVALLCRRFLPSAVTLMVIVLMLSAVEACASIPNQIYRVDIHPKKDFTRLTVSLADPPQYTLAAIPGSRLRLVIEDTGGTLFKKFRRYSDKNIGGLTFKRRGDSLLVTFQVSPQVGWRDLSRPDISAITLDIGAQFKPGAPQPSMAGREKIWKGVEKLVRDFDPPLKSEIPFTQTDRQVLRNFLSEEEQKDFMAAEAALYKGSLTEAEELFSRFSSRQGPIRALALYRLGETWYKLQKYPQALAAFREAEKMWPGYLGLNPGITFYYGDSIARSGELAHARSLLASLAARLADKTFAPALLVRLGDILTRQGHEHEARAIYQNVADHFKDNKASQMALMRIADSEFLQSTPWNYRPISSVYLNASRHSGDLDMREEAHFKYVLLESIHGEAGEALQLVMGFQHKFPRGVYVAVVRTIREVLVAEVYRGTDWTKEPAALVRFMEEQSDYLADTVEQPGFLATVTRAYNEAGRPIELVKLLAVLVERLWSTPVAPELYVSIVDNSELIGDTATAERAIKTFLSKFPADPSAKLMTERLGSIYFSSGKYLQVKETLLWLLNKGMRARIAESYYRLGRSLWELKLHKQAAKAIGLYLGAPQGIDPRTLPDAYFVGGSSLEATGDKKGALKLFEAALKLPDNPRKDEFIYRTAQINLREGKAGRAKELFEQLVKNGKDRDWQQLARQALASLEIRSATP